MSFRNLFLGLAVLSLSLVSCAKKNDLSENPNAPIGLYKATSEKMKQVNADYFFVSVDKSLYLIQKDQTKYKRDYYTNLSKVDFTLSEGKFESGNVTGTKMVGNEPELPENLRLMAELNQLAVQLKDLVNPDGIEVDFRLELSEPSFNENQRDILQKLVAQKDVLVTYLKSKSLDKFWINDYAAYTKMYTMDGGLRLPALANVRGDEIITNLKESKNID